MTRDGDWSGEAPQAGHRNAGQQAPHGAAQAAGGEASRIEALLHSVIDRLEENETRYNQALGSLESRLGELSARAAGTAADTPRGREEDDTFARLGAQASELARQVRSASQAERPRHDDSFRAAEDRISEFAAQMQQRAAPPSPAPPQQQHYPRGEPAQTPQTHDAAPYGFSQQFADAAAGFERSLAEGHATAELEAINARIDDLVERFDAMTVGRGADKSMLDTVEIQLNNLAAQFDQAREHYARVDAIEQNLVHLMDMTRQSESRIEAAAMRAAEEAARHAGGANRNVSDRLDAVQRELQTLASMASRRPEAAGEARDAVHTPPPAPAPPPEPAYAPPSGAGGSLQDDIERSRAGASIPDYQQSPGFADSPAGARAAEAPNPARHFDDDADLLASARRAAAAAAAAGAKPERRKKGLFQSLRRSGRKRAETPGEAAKPRGLFVAATVFLMIASAALIYGRMNENGDTPAVEAPGGTAPADKDRAGRKPDTSSMLSATPDSAEKKDESKLSTGGAPAGEEEPRAPLASERLPAPRLPAPPEKQSASFDSGGADRDANRDPGAFPSKVHIDPGIPGIAVRIMDRDEAPQAASATPQVKEASAPAQTDAPAPSGRAPASPMPPAAIGPQSLRLAAARGAAAAQYEIATRYAKGNGVKQDFKQAAEWYSRAAAQSLAPAQYRLAALYERGSGVEKDPAMARLWYERAAKAGNIRAMHNLGVIHSGGGNHRPNHAEAAKWFTEAARHGLADSQFNLGILHETGLGVKQNLAEAYQWFSLAAARGDEEAEKRKQAAAGKLRSDELRTADQAVRQWRARPANKQANEARAPEGGWRAASAGASSEGSGPENASVLRAQSLLNKLGYEAGVPDGVQGPRTSAAIRRFQERNGITEDGKLTPELVSRLEALAS